MHVHIFLKTKWMQRTCFYLLNNKALDIFSAAIFVLIISIFILKICILLKITREFFCLVEKFASRDFTWLVKILLILAHSLHVATCTWVCNIHPSKNYHLKELLLYTIYCAHFLNFFLSVLKEVPSSNKVPNWPST